MLYLSIFKRQLTAAILEKKCLKEMILQMFNLQCIERNIFIDTLKHLSDNQCISIQKKSPFILYQSKIFNFDFNKWIIRCKFNMISFQFFRNSVAQWLSVVLKLLFNLVLFIRHQIRCIRCIEVYAVCESHNNYIIMQRIYYEEAISFAI